MNNRTQLLGVAVLIGLCCVGLCVVGIDILGSKLERIPGDLVDSRLNNYILEHGFKWLSGQVESFWDAPFLYPVRNTIAYSDSHLGTLPIYAIFRLMGLSRETSFQAWIISILVLKYAASAWVLRAFSFSWLGAAAGAYVFTFSLPFLAQVTHLQLLPRFFVPFGFLFVWRYLRVPNLKNFAGVAVSVLLQIYCDIYIGYFLLLALGAFFLVIVVMERRNLQWKDFSRRPNAGFHWQALVVVAAGVLLLPLAIPYYQAYETTGPRSWEEISSMLPRWQSFFLPAENSLLWFWLEPLGSAIKEMIWEHRLFMGGLPWLALASVVLIRPSGNRTEHERLTRCAILTLPLVAGFCVYWNGYSLYRALIYLPGPGAIRTVTRVILVLSFLFSIAVAYFFGRVESAGRGRRYFPIAVSLILTLLVLDQVVLFAPTYHKQESVQRILPIVQQLENNPSAQVFAYLSSESSRISQVITHVDAMMASQTVGIPTVNAYSGGAPPYYPWSSFNHVWAVDQWVFYAENLYGRGVFKNLVILGARDEPRGNLSLPTQPLADIAFRGEIACPEESSLTIQRGQSKTILVRVLNEGEQTWPALPAPDGRYAVYLSYRWLSQTGEPLTGFERRFGIHYDLPPHKSVDLNVPIEGRYPAGQYFLEFDLVQELVAWFHQKGSPMARFEITIKD